MSSNAFIVTLLQAKANVERATTDYLARWWDLGEVVVNAPDGYTLQDMADAVGLSKGTLSKAATIRKAWDRPTGIVGDTVDQAYANAREALGKVTTPKAAPKFDASKVLAKMDKRQRRALYAALQAEFGN